MNIGLFFGSFNPIHIGHLAIANYMVEFTDIDQLWFIISPQNPLKKKLVSLGKWLKMVDLLGLCNICGKPGAMFTCHMCGKLVCPSCFDKEHGICKQCFIGKIWSVCAIKFYM